MAKQSTANDYSNVEQHHENRAAAYNIRVLSPKKFQEALASHLKYTDFTRHRAPVVGVEGESGVGKTAIIKQVVEGLGWGLLSVRVANMSEGHIDGFPMPTEEAIELRMVKQYYDKIQTIVTSGKRLVIFFDELNRAKQALIKTIFNIIDEKIWAGVQLPEDTVFIIATNPPTDIHNVTDIYGTEAALASRVKLFGIKADLQDFLAYADTQPDFHWMMKDYVKNHPQRLTDYQNMYSGKRYSCPAVLDNVAHFLSAAEKDGHDLSDLRVTTHLYENLVGFVGTTTANEICEFLADMSKSLTPQKVLDDYPTVRQVIKNPKVMGKAVEGEDGALGAVLAKKMGSYIGANRPDFEKNPVWAQNVAAFMKDQQDETLVMFTQSMIRELSDHMRDYVPKMAAALRKYPDYLEASQRLITNQTAGQQTFGQKGA